MLAMVNIIIGGVSAGIFHCHGISVAVLLHFYCLFVEDFHIQGLTS
ncbi:MAG: hypothetical protein ACLR0U_27040 [Enterocloster clostridioformis]